MSRLGELLGSKTRGNIIEALALADRPLSAYKVAKSYGQRKGIDHGTWREAGVSAAVLERAGIARGKG